MLEFLDMESDGLENLVVVCRVTEVHHLVGEESDINNAAESLSGINDGDREEFVEDEALAGLQQSCRLRKGKDSPDHHVGNALFQGFGQQFSGRNHADQLPLVVDDVEIEDPLLKADRPDRLKGLTNGLGHGERRRTGS